MLSPAAQDLGLGDQLKQQLDDAEAERRKKALLAQKASMVTQGTFAPATVALYGASGGFQV